MKLTDLQEAKLSASKYEVFHVYWVENWNIPKPPYVDPETNVLVLAKGCQDWINDDYSHSERCWIDFAARDEDHAKQFVNTLDPQFDPDDYDIDDFWEYGGNSKNYTHDEVAALATRATSK